MKPARMTELQTVEIQTVEIQTVEIQTVEIQTVEIQTGNTDGETGETGEPHDSVISRQRETRKKMRPWHTLGTETTNATDKITVADLSSGYISSRTLGEILTFLRDDPSAVNITELDLSYSRLVDDDIQTLANALDQVGDGKSKKKKKYY